MINGLDELYAKLGRLSAASQDMGVKSAKDAIKRVQAKAKENCHVNHGELRNSISTLTRKSEEGAIAVCYTNKEYAEYVENGTGPKGARNHSGISPDVHPVYSQKPWWIPSDKIDAADAEKYHFFSWTYHLDGYLGYEKTFYQTSGQAAHPFLYPALKDGEKEVLDAMTRSARISIGKEIHD